MHCGTCDATERTLFICLTDRGLVKVLTKCSSFLERYVLKTQSVESSHNPFLIQLEALNDRILPESPMHV